MITEGYEQLKTPILNLMKTSLRTNYTPKSWQETGSVIIAKPGKDDYSQARAYRIISLTGNFLKIMEKLILWHMQEDLKIEASLDKSQYGFRKGSSTEAALLNLINKICRKT